MQSSWELPGGEGKEIGGEQPVSATGRNHSYSDLALRTRKLRVVLLSLRRGQGEGALAQDRARLHCLLGSGC